MEKSLDGLLSHLVEQIALTGEFGSTPAQFRKNVRSYHLKSNDQDDVSDEVRSTPNLDDPFLEYIWKLLTNDPEIQVGDHGQYSNLSLAEAEASYHHQRATKPSVRSVEPSAPTEGRPSEPDLNEVTDPHPVPDVGSTPQLTEPTRLTHDEGTSLPRETNELDVPSHTGDDFEQPERNAEQQGIRIFASEKCMWYALTGHEPDPARIKAFDFVLLSIIASCGSQGILQFDLVRVSGQDKRSVPNRTDRLHEQGHIVKKSITTLTHARKEVSKIVSSHCVLARFAEEPQYQAEFQRLIDEAKRKPMKKLRKPKTIENPEVVSEEILAQEAIANNLELPESSKITALWIPDRPICKQIYDVVDRAGSKGATLFEIRNALWGDHYKKPSENILNRLVNAWQISQPLHLRHLAVVRDTVLQSKSPIFVHFTFPHYEELVKLGRKSWKAVTTLSYDTVLGGVSASLEEVPELDDHGFAKIDTKLFEKDGFATLAECARSPGRPIGGLARKVSSQRAIDNELLMESETRPGLDKAPRPSPRKRRRSKSSPNEISESRQHGTHVSEIMKLHESPLEKSSIQRSTAAGKKKGRPRKHQNLEGAEDFDKMDDDELREFQRSRSAAERYQKSKMDDEIERRISLGQDSNSAAIGILQETDDLIQRGKQDPVFPKVRSQILHAHAGGPLPQPTKLDLEIQNRASTGKPRNADRLRGPRRRPRRKPYWPSIAAHTHHIVGYPPLLQSTEFRPVNTAFPAVDARTRKRKITIPEELLPAKKKKGPYQKQKPSGLEFEYLPSIAAHSGSFLPSTRKDIEVEILPRPKKPKISHSPFSKMTQQHASERVGMSIKAVQTSSLLPQPGKFFTVEEAIERRYEEQVKDLDKSHEFIHVAKTISYKRRSDELQSIPGKRFKLVIFRLKALRSSDWMTTLSTTTQAVLSQTGAVHIQRHQVHANRLTASDSVMENVQAVNTMSAVVSPILPPEAQTPARQVDLSTELPAFAASQIARSLTEPSSGAPLGRGLTLSNALPPTNHLVTPQSASSEIFRGRNQKRKRKQSPKPSWPRKLQKANEAASNVPSNSTSTTVDSFSTARSPEEKRKSDCSSSQALASPKSRPDNTPTSPTGGHRGSVPATVTSQPPFRRQALDFSRADYPTAGTSYPRSSAREKVTLWVVLRVPSERLRPFLNQNRTFTVKASESQRQAPMSSTTQVLDSSEAPSKASPNPSAPRKRHYTNPHETMIAIGKVRRTGGTTALIRKDIILELVKECGGVAPGYKDMALPFAMEWTRRGNPGQPETETVRTAVNALCSAGKLRQITFAYKTPEGLPRKRTMIISSDVNYQDPRIREMQDNLAKSGQKSFLPKEWLQVDARNTDVVQPFREEPKHTNLYHRFNYHQQRLQQNEQAEEERNEKRERLAKLRTLLERNNARVMIPDVSIPYGKRRMPKHWNHRFAMFLGEQLGSGNLRRRRKEQREGYFADPVFQDPDANTWHTIPAVHVSTLPFKSNATPTLSRRIGRPRQSDRMQPISRRLPKLLSQRQAASPEPSELSENHTEDEEIVPSSSDSSSDDSHDIVTVRPKPAPKLVKPDLAARPAPLRRIIKSRAARRPDCHIVPSYMRPRQPYQKQSGTFGTSFNGYIRVVALRSPEKSIQGVQGSILKPRRKLTVMNSFMLSRQTFHATSGTFGTPFEGFGSEIKQPTSMKRIIRRPQNAFRPSSRELVPSAWFMRPAQQFHGPSGTFGTIFGIFLILSAKRPRGVVPSSRAKTRETEPRFKLTWPENSSDQVHSGANRTLESPWASFTNRNGSSESTPMLATLAPKPWPGVHVNTVWDPSIGLSSYSTEFTDEVLLASSFQDEIKESLKWELDQPSLLDLTFPSGIFINHTFPHDHEIIDAGPVNIDYGNMYTVKENGRLSAKPVSSFTREQFEPSFDALAVVKPAKGNGRQVTFALEDSDSAESEMEYLDHATPNLRVHAGRRKGPLSRRSISAADQHRLVTAVTVVRCLTGGLEKRVNWSLVAKVFEDEMDEEFIVARWNKTRENAKADMAKIETAFQDIFAQGYEEDTVPAIDYNDLNSYPWKWLVQWVIDNSDLSASLVEVPDLPLDRYILSNEYTLEEVPSDDFNKYYELDSTVATSHRQRVLSQRAWTIPIDHDNNCYSSDPVDDEESLAIAKSWIRANVVTPPETYSADAAHAKLSQIPKPTIEAALSDLLTSKIITTTPSKSLRCYTLNESILSRLEKTIKVSDLQRATSFKSYLDLALENHGSLIWSRHAQNGDMIVVMNLLAAGRVTLKTENVPANEWGHTDGGYKTRQMDRMRLFCDALVLPTERYEMGLPLLPLPDAPGQVCEEGDSADGGDWGRQKLPLWIDIHGHLVPRLWEVALAGVLCIVVTRPGIGVKEVGQTLKGSLEVWEVEMVLEWLVRASAVGRGDGVIGAGRRYVTEEWWWCVLGDGQEEDDGVDAVVEDGTWPTV
ncbi:uncharacterized protein KY384_004792 [Bacidia gigantensis]|uniref:uncharacterized protein n=1 Tax=Bacidia gigantensis TaxID=2732470 RepID=UPI001D03638D|nr:uncharacterized protein KY384_004792 [Bacidia gigantensis]KAG8530290.1 hypothetical protein KY384_004792 [Bacidia gigantensis]